MGKKRRAGVLKKLNTHKFGDYNFFEMPALPKGIFFLGAAMYPSTFGKAAQVFTNVVGRLPSLAGSNRWLHFG